MTKAILIMGKPGAGKGTQGPRIAQHYFAPHISTGDLFRDEYARKTELGMQAHSYWGNGNYVPDDVTTSMLKKKLEGIERTVLDGFPRTIAQAEALDSIVDVEAAILLEVSDSVAAGRLANRLMCKGCNTVYGLAKTPLKNETCDYCSSELYRREDDKDPAKIRTRLREYAGKTEEVLDFYEEKGLLLTVEADKHHEEVFEAAIKLLQEGATKKHAH